MRNSLRAVTLFGTSFAALLASSPTLAPNAGAQPHEERRDEPRRGFERHEAHEPYRTRHWEFDDRFRGNPPLADAWKRWHATGGFSLLKIERSEPLTITVLLQEKYSDDVERLDLSLESDDPPTLRRYRIEAAARPAELADS